MPCHQLDLPRARETIAALRIQVVAAERGQDQQAFMRIAAKTQPQYTLIENASLRPRNRELQQRTGPVIAQMRRVELELRQLRARSSSTSYVGVPGCRPRIDSSKIESYWRPVCCNKACFWRILVIV
jgi:hypothetical protein